MALPAGVSLITNIKGDTGTIDYGTAETVDWTQGPSVEMLGDPAHRGVHFKIPIPVPGPELLSMRDETVTARNGAVDARDQAEVFSATMQTLQDAAVESILADPDSAAYQRIESQTNQRIVEQTDERIAEYLAGLLPDPGGLATIADWAALYEADGLVHGTLTSWGDTSGNGHDLQVLQHAAPSVVTWRGGKAVHFVGSPMAAQPFASLWPVSIVVIGQTTAFPGWFVGSDAARINRASSSASPAGVLRAVGSHTIDSPFSDNDPHLMIGMFDGANSSFIVDNTVTRGVLNPAVGAGMTNLVLGGWSTSEHHLSGYIAAVAVFQGVLSNEQIHQIRSVAQAKYGLP